MVHVVVKWPLMLPDKIRMFELKHKLDFNESYHIFLEEKIENQEGFVSLDVAFRWNIKPWILNLQDHNLLQSFPSFWHLKLENLSR